MRKILLLVSIIFLSFISWISGTVFAQETPEAVAEKYNVAFPIKELGNCENFSECRQFCEDPVNAESCIAFAKKKGFYKEESVGDTQIIAKAKASLGCNSEESCRNFCNKEENFDKCNNFARQNKLVGGRVEDPGKTEVIQKAKTILGCSSEATCRQVCDLEENREKCSQFARQTGLRGGESRSGPGGCTSEETCTTFCSDPANYQVCSGYANSRGGNFSGPGGCNSEESCRNYCETNKEACMNFGRSQGYNPEEMCRKTPNCSWSNNSCQCNSYTGQNTPNPSGYGSDYSRSYDSEAARECGRRGCYWVPGQSKCDCANKTYQSSEPECRRVGCNWNGTTCNCSSTSGGSSSGSYNYSADPAKSCTQYPGCSWNGNYCSCSSTSGSYVKPTSGMGSDPAGECSRYGCSWTGSTCDCSNRSSSGNPEQDCTNTSGCRWTGSSCDCSANSTQTQTQPQGESQTFDYAAECTKNAGCSWNGSSCQCGGVQGANAKKESLLDKILNFFQF